MVDQPHHGGTEFSGLLGLLRRPRQPLAPLHGKLFLLGFTQGLRLPALLRFGILILAAAAAALWLIVL